MFSPHSDTKDLTTDYRQLDVRWLDDEGVLTPGWCGPLTWIRGDEQVAKIELRCEFRTKLRLIYTTSTRYGGDPTKHDYPVFLEYTEPHFGGERPWFLCPGKGCGRRCAILYGGEVFVCRECRDLAYPRENVSGSRSQELRHRLRKLADKLEVNRSRWGGMSWPLEPSRPKGMHKSTYQDLLAEYREVRREHQRAVTAKMVKLAEAADADLGLSDEQREMLKQRDGI